MRLEEGSAVEWLVGGAVSLGDEGLVLVAVVEGALLDAAGPTVVHGRLRLLGILNDTNDLERLTEHDPDVLRLPP